MRPAFEDQDQRSWRQRSVSFAFFTKASKRSITSSRGLADPPITVLCGCAKPIRPSTSSTLATALVDVQQAIAFLFVVFFFIGSSATNRPSLRRCGSDVTTMPCREHSGD